MGSNGSNRKQCEAMVAMEAMEINGSMCVCMYVCVCVCVCACYYVCVSIYNLSGLITPLCNLSR